jgi:cation diffusion facilitator CzcD-associated flavoprotein CzcO
MTTTINTIIVGGGQAGLSVSHFLKELSVDHVVLEQASLPGEAWRNHRWDSFTLNTPAETMRTSLCRGTKSWQGSRNLRDRCRFAMAHA